MLKIKVFHFTPIIANHKSGNKHVLKIVVMKTYVTLTYKKFANLIKCS
jgi:hypothetical protein